MSVSSTAYTIQTPPLAEYAGMSSFFGGEAPLNVGVGYAVVLGFGFVVSIVTSLMVWLNDRVSGRSAITSEHFNTAGRSVKTGLIASVIVSQWTWAATLLQSSNVAWQYGVSGPFWYASGATIQVLLFGVVGIRLKMVAPSAHTMCEIVRARWGKAAHITFLIFGFMANIIVTSMLILGGAATTEALTGMKSQLAAFLIPWGVILYTWHGGLHATFLSAYLHTLIIMLVLVIMITIVYIKVYGSDIIYYFLNNTIMFTPEECATIFSPGGDTPDETFYKQGVYACGPVKNNEQGSYLTFISGGGLMFGIINIIGNFGTVFVDQSYWMSAIAARPESAAKGYLLGGLCWFAIPFSLATSLGLSAAALMLPITAQEAGSGLVPPAVAQHYMGTAGCVLILVMLFMAITSTGSAECLAVSSLCTYDIYRTYINPDATGEQILRVSRAIVLFFGIFMGCFAIALQYIGLNLGWVYLFMGVVIGSAVIPMWNLVNNPRASAGGAVCAAWGGMILGVVGWLAAAKINGGKVTVATLGADPVMLSGNLISIISSGIIHWLHSTFIDKEVYDFSKLNDGITLVEEDMSGLGEEERNPAMLKAAYKWITRRGYFLTFVLIIVWPVLSVPAKVFSPAYFAFWVFISIIWGFTATAVITFLPLMESSTALMKVCNGTWNMIFPCCKVSEGDDSDVVVAMPPAVTKEEPAKELVEEPLGEEVEAS